MPRYSDNAVLGFLALTLKFLSPSGFWRNLKFNECSVKEHLDAFSKPVIKSTIVVMQWRKFHLEEGQSNISKISNTNFSFEGIFFAVLSWFGIPWKQRKLCYSDNEVKEALKEVRTLAVLNHEGIVRYNCSWIEKPPEGWQVRYLWCLVFSKCNLDFQRKVDDELVRRLLIREKVLTKMIS